MFTVFTTTLIAGLVDGLNPIALTQQFVLQAKSKSPYSILYFIFANSLVNFLFGLVFYFGFSEWITLAFTWVNSHYPKTWPALAIIFGLAIVAYLIYTFIGKKKENAPSAQEVESPEAGTLSNKSLFMIGVATCAAELSSAAPYLALLGYFATVNMTSLQATLLLAFYSFILYVLPLYGLFFMSLFFNSKLTTIYTRIAQWLDFALNRVLPIILSFLALALLWFGMQAFSFY